MIKKICLSMCLLSFLGSHQVSGAKVKIYGVGGSQVSGAKVKIYGVGGSQVSGGPLDNSEGHSENLISRPIQPSNKDLSNDVESFGGVRRCGSSSKKLKALVITGAFCVVTVIAVVLGGFFKGWFSSGGSSENAGVHTGGDEEQLFRAFQNSGLSRKALIHGYAEGPCQYQSGPCSPVTLFESGRLSIGEVRRFSTYPNKKCPLKEFDCPLPVGALKEGFCMEMLCGGEG